MSIIRYRYKADKNFESVKIDGMSCSLGELKRLIAAKSTKPGSHPVKHDYDLIISDANTHEEYKDNSDLIPRNASVIVARRIRGTSEALTPFSNQRPTVNTDDIVSGILLPAIKNQKNDITSALPAPMIDPKPAPLDKVSETINTSQTKELSESELIKEIQMGSQARYVTTQPAYRTNLFICHNCKQPGHIKTQCPHLPQNSTSNSTGNSSTTNSTDSTTTKSDGTTSSTTTMTTTTTSTTNNTTNSTGVIRTTLPHQAGVYTRHAPYSHTYYHTRGMRSHHRGPGHPREPVPKKTTGIPRDRLIPVPKHIPGALKDPTGASVVPTQMAELFVEQIGKKANSANQLGKQGDGKGSASASGPAAKSMNEDPPPEELLCPLCKQVCTDAVITPCCNFSFCDECIRNALIESPDHKCPHCERLHVAIDQINPNLFLRNHVNRWRERQNQLSYSHLLPSQSMGIKIDLDSDSAKRTSEFSSDPIDEFDAALLSTTTPESSITTAPIKNAPIVIKMQPMSKSHSPPPSSVTTTTTSTILSTRPADLTFEDEKTTDSSQTTSSQKSGPNGENNVIEENPITPPEQVKSESGTPPSQSTPTNPLFPSSSPTTSLPGNTPVLSHYYPPNAAPAHQLVPPVQTNVLYPHHLPPAPANGLYPMQPNYYPPPMGIRYPTGAIHPYPAYVPGPPVHPHHPAAPPVHPHHPHHPLIAPPHVPNSPINGLNVPPFLPQHNAPFAATSTSTFIAHHQTATQPIPAAIPAALSEHEFYTKQRYFQRFNRSPSSRRRSRSRSSSYSSYSSSDSRSSSRSRYDRRNRRSSRSRSPRRTENRRTKSPSRNDRRPRRSPSYRDRRGPTSSRDNYPSKYRKSSPRRSSRERERDRERDRERKRDRERDRERERERDRERERERERDRERRRSPRPPPTVQQSTQRTIVYMHESSTSGRDRSRRTRSRSRGNDDRYASSSSKTEQKSQSDSIASSVTVGGTPTLSSIVETVLPDNSEVSNEKDPKPMEQPSTNLSNEENSSKSAKKHKKHHHKKHRRQGSKSKKHRRSKDKDKEKKNTADSPSTAIVPVQS